MAIVIVNRSLEAANAIIAGNNVNWTASIIMALPSEIARIREHRLRAH
ncbi:MAG: hypothetical protein WA280_18370 [Xanthobacteraceae bacterium]